MIATITVTTIKTTATKLNKGLNRMTLKRTLLACSLLCGTAFAYAEKSEDPKIQVSNISHKSELAKRPVLKLTDAQLEEIASDDNYDPSHSENVYSLYMTDIGYGKSDQYIDGIVRFALQSDYDRYVMVVKDKADNNLISKEVSKELLKSLKNAKDNKTFDTTFKANFLVELDNKIALEFVSKKYPDLKDQAKNRPAHINNFNVHDYFSQKFAIYLRTVENRFQNTVSPYEQKDWADRAYITPTTTIYRTVSESHLKPKLRSIVANEVRYGELTEHEKVLIMWWMDQLK